MSLATWNNKKREQTIIMEMGRGGNHEKGRGMGKDRGALCR